MVAYMTPGRAHNAGKKMIWMILAIYFLASALFLGLTSIITKLAGDELGFALTIAGTSAIGSLSCFLAWRKERQKKEFE